MCDVCVRFLFAVLLRQFRNPVYERDSEHTDVIPVDSGRFRSVNLSRRIRTTHYTSAPTSHIRTVIKPATTSEDWGWFRK